MSNVTASNKVRDINIIAREIYAKWPKVYFGAVPYLSAMTSLKTVNDSYYNDSAKSIIMYFLSNASTWRGEDAKRIKAELNKMIK